MSSGTFFIKKPTGARRTFAIVQRVNVGGKSTQPTLDLPEVDSINKQFKKGLLTFEQALQMMEKVKADLFQARDDKSPKALFASVNLKVQAEYLAVERTRKQNIDWVSTEAEVRRAIQAAGQLSLVSATQAQLQEEINAKFEDNPNKQRRVVSRLNSILAFLNRGFHLGRAPEEFPEVKHVTEDAMLAACTRIEEPLVAMLVKVAFYTGARLGECFAMDPEHIKGKSVFIAYQIDDSLKRRATKNRKRRNAFILPAGRAVTKEWASVPRKLRLEIRHKRVAEIVARATQDEDMCFHALRHSYAYALAMRGSTNDDIARYLGNSAAVCERYYIGWIQGDAALDRTEALFTPPEAKP
jgi:integrase